ncbi:poly-gamma-glutamate synthase PgsB [Fusobacterium sp.]|uniref:poly-gamma-glutamate synthase PgsB n=1 Tax=Fusobacterium sp. TaxID=68766 RepID=UPI0025C56164|nr:poly-gamma-glutamate synthase PgsB [Fusobacterium sp.]MCI5725177.1 poly-gamma-glutamate synthase PgsB [Fusobacterium sp.]
MFFLILVLIFLFFSYFIFEKIKNDRNRKRIKYLIHVNGIRGKSTVSRLIDAGLREAGFKVFTKITGTSPRIIDTAGVEKEILRKGKANIREQIKAINWACKEGAEILILECMAVNPEFQKITEEKILKADIAVITNVREDHLDEMGENLSEIAKSLANTIPQKGKLITAAENYFDFFKKEAEKKCSQVFLVDENKIEDKKEYEKIDFPINVALALETCKQLYVDEKILLKGMKKYKKDSGVLKIYYLKINDKKIFFINAMAANDPDSTEIILEKIKKDRCWRENKKILLLNNRKDRISRAEQHVKLIKKIENQFDEIIIFGENRNLLKKMVLKENISPSKVSIKKDSRFLNEITENSLIFAIGNICGRGKELVEFFESREEINNDKYNIDSWNNK